MQQLFYYTMSEEHMPFVKEMVYQSIYVAPGSIPPSRDILDHPRIANYFTNFDHERDLGIVAAQEDGTFVGMAMVRFFRLPLVGYGYVADHIPELSIAIDEHHRGQNIGTTLLHKLLDMCRHNGISAVSLSVSKGNPAVSLYARAGFRTISEDENSLTMQLSIL